MKPVHLFVVFTLFALSSCVKDFPLPENSKAPTLNALFSPQDGLRVYLTESISATGQATQQTATAASSVKLFENEQFLENMVFVPSTFDAAFGYYKTTKHLQEGRSYQVVAQTLDYGAVSAADSIPAGVALSGLQIQFDTSSGSGTLYFSDNGNTADFYRLNVYTRGKIQALDSLGDTIVVAYNVTCRPQLTEQLSDTIRDSRNFLFSDRSFNGSTQYLHFSFSLPDTAYMVSQSLYVELNHVSRTHFEYYKTLSLYRGSAYNAEPVHIFGNIQNGNGIFAAQSISRRMVVLK